MRLFLCLSRERARAGKEREGCKVGSGMTWYQAGSWVTMEWAVPVLAYITLHLLRNIIIGRRQGREKNTGFSGNILF